METTQGSVVPGGSPEGQLNCGKAELHPWFGDQSLGWGWVGCDEPAAVMSRCFKRNLKGSTGTLHCVCNYSVNLKLSPHRVYLTAVLVHEKFWPRARVCVRAGLSALGSSLCGCVGSPS